MRLRGLSLWQPWATLMAIGAKRIETRSWSTPYRGPVLIHATKVTPGPVRDVVYQEPFRQALCAAYGSTIDPFDLPRGLVVAIGRLVRCVAMTPETIALVPEPEASFGHFATGRYAWVFEEVEEVPPFAASGDHRGLWRVDEQTMQRLVSTVGRGHPLLRSEAL